MPAPAPWHPSATEHSWPPAASFSEEAWAPSPWTSPPPNDLALSATPNAIADTAATLGSVDDIDQIITITGTVAVEPTFTDHGHILDTDNQPDIASTASHPYPETPPSPSKSSLQSAPANHLFPRSRESFSRS
ncbi:hypothetical protein GCM10010988_39300 [Cnuibacter physcomitrellae]|uniref:hypothetical protein n=1 Tax=Cnuibacter physcomitrellae TaxID=1619308 RepID=UPI0012F4CCFD|nr:hypothetical protein [Cnuibacter physcomitrellae]GGI42492.1 hypothetical protein GCM10010988_39300 [Cnuibacter physcomitrellae]